MRDGDAVVRYRGYEIESGSQKLKDTHSWTVRVIITKHRDAAGVSNQRGFSASTTYPTQEEANEAALRLGREIIDGKVPKFTVGDL